LPARSLRRRRRSYPRNGAGGGRGGCRALRCSVRRLTSRLPRFTGGAPGGRPSAAGTGSPSAAVAGSVMGTWAGASPTSRGRRRGAAPEHGGERDDRGDHRGRDGRRPADARPSDLSSPARPGEPRTLPFSPPTRAQRGLPMRLCRYSPPVADEQALRTSPDAGSRGRRRGARRSPATCAARSSRPGRSMARHVGACGSSLRDRAAQRGRLPLLPVPVRARPARAAGPQPEDHRRRPPLPDLQGRPRYDDHASSGQRAPGDGRRRPGRARRPPPSLPPATTETTSRPGTGRSLRGYPPAGERPDRDAT